jgi:hypothetical protein
MTASLTGRHKNNNVPTKTINNGWITAAICLQAKQMTSMNYKITYTMP